MLGMRALLPGILRLLATGTRAPFVFDQRPVLWPAKPESLNLYIHLPFCRQLCAFCPYVKEIYDPELSIAYQGAIIKELAGYREFWGDITVASVYFGGGTPSLTPDIVANTLSWIDRHFQLGREVGVEVHPLDTGKDVLDYLKSSGVSLVSLGVQTFHDHLLDVLGRGYDGNLARRACERLLQTGFTTTDIDLIFAIPDQTRAEAVADIETACQLGVGQISTYPLIPFSYTPLRDYLYKRGLSLPSWRQERQLLKAMVSRARQAGYQRTSIWSFNQPGTTRYTTVTKDAFVGIGAGAASRMGDYFAVNTFFVAEYIKAVARGSPLALSTRLKSSDKIAYWLFWQCYNQSVDLDDFRRIFTRNLPYRARALLNLLGILGITHRQNNTLRLTDEGAYLFTLVEREYTHAYLETLWAACLKEPYPRRVML